MDSVNPARQDHPGSAVHALPDDVRDHHGGAGGGLGRRPHAVLGLSLFSIGWLLFVYVPLAHWVWGGGFLGAAWACSISPAALVVHLNPPASAAWSRPRCSARHGYGTENLAPFDLSLAVIGTGLLWVGWFGFNGGSALARIRAR
jgi:ammonia channel protein AmtB